jgi:hypothetical protein
LQVTEVTAEANAAPLEIEVANLWTRQMELTGKAKKSRQELTDIRLRLAARLSELKKYHSRPGREGRWSRFLRE